MASSELHLKLRNRLLSLPDDPELLDELRNDRLRETSLGVVRIDHDAAQHDDRAIALALAASEPLLDRPVAFGRADIEIAVPMTSSVGYGTPSYDNPL